MYYFFLEKDIPTSLKSHIVINTNLVFEEKTRDEVSRETNVGHYSLPLGFYLEEDKKYYYTEIEEDEADAHKLSDLNGYIQKNYPSTIYLFDMGFDSEGLGIIECNLGNGRFENYTLDHNNNPVLHTKDLADEVKKLLTLDADAMVNELTEIHRYLKGTVEKFSKGTVAMFESSLDNNNTRSSIIKEVLKSLDCGAITQEDAIRMIGSINSEGGK